jgi:hypothetical protein
MLGSMCKLVGLTAIPSKYKIPMWREPGKTKELDKMRKSVGMGSMYYLY